MSDECSPPTLPIVQPYHPITFLERGAAVPFTTPMLSGTRTRPADRGGSELLVPNPSGGRGVYVVPWAGVRDLCTPTVHDARLHHRVTSMPAVTPSAVRIAARDVAAEGLAGEAAQAAALASRESDQADTLMVNFLLLMLLIEQVEPSGTQPAMATDGVLEDRARRAVTRIAPQLGMDADSVAATLEEMAVVFQSIGTPNQGNGARLPRVLALLEETRAQVADWTRTHVTEDYGACGEMIVSVADVTLSLAGLTLTKAGALTNDMAGLMRSWRRSKNGIATTVSKPEWLLDGWEQICLLWRDAESLPAQRSALVEMAELVPVLPREAADWAGLSNLLVDTQLNRPRLVPINHDWRTGLAVLDIIARNERLRAKCL